MIRKQMVCSSWATCAAGCVHIHMCIAGSVWIVEYLCQLVVGGGVGGCACTSATRFTAADIIPYLCEQQES